MTCCDLSAVDGCGLDPYCLLLSYRCLLCLARLHTDAVHCLLGNVALDGACNDGASVVELVKVLHLEHVHCVCYGRMGVVCSRRTQLPRQCVSNWARAATQGLGMGLSVV